MNAASSEECPVNAWRRVGRPRARIRAPRFASNPVEGSEPPRVDVAQRDEADGRGNLDQAKRGEPVEDYRPDEKEDRYDLEDEEQRRGEVPRWKVRVGAHGTRVYAPGRGGVKRPQRERARAHRRPGRRLGRARCGA